MTNCDRVRALNDSFRRTFEGGVVVMTSTVSTLEPSIRQEIVRLIQAFDNFAEDNDPHGEHDFGSLEVDDETYFWKIDYYDPTMSAGSEDASDPKKTARVLTIMRADEY